MKITNASMHSQNVIASRLKAVAKQSPIAMFAFAFLFAACSENETSGYVTNINQTGVDVVDSVDDLPKCQKDNEGYLVFVKGENSARICVDGKWFATKDSSNADDFSCTTKELKDKSGIKIICNGDSIGVVQYGSAGKNGNECVAEEQTDSTVVINCGGQSMTLNLGAATVRDSLEPDSEMIAISLDTLSGVSQKGPFLKGSTVFLYELSDGRTLKQTNGNFVSNITSDDGRFRFTTRNLMSQYALIVVDGKYRNEVTGKPTNTAIRLQAYTDVLSRKNANVNLLTQLEMNRVYYLVTREKKRFKVAKHQAQMEIFDAFHIDTTGFSKSSEDLNVFGSSDADAALLALSILLQGDSSETVLSVLLTEIADDMESDGSWDDPVTRARIADWAATMDSSVSTSKSKLAEFRSHVEDWSLGGGNVPDFEKYIRKFWSKELGLGVCGDKNNPVGIVKWVPNKKSDKYYASSYTAADNKVRFICADAKLSRWRAATDIEKDRYNWKPENTKDGSFLNGQISGRKMVWDADTLRYASDMEIDGGKGCTKYNRKELLILKKRYSYSKCTESGWEYTLDTLNLQDTLKYNGQTYKTVGIKTQYWMAENLNYKVENSFCYDDSDDNCAKYGRLYTWSAAVGKTKEECDDSKTCGLSGNVQGICPKGWHLPSDNELKVLYSAIGNSPHAMQAKEVTNWSDATNAYGFSALPAGDYYAGDFRYIGSSAFFWSSVEKGNSAYSWRLDANEANLTNFSKTNAFSVRCIMDTSVDP